MISRSTSVPDSDPEDSARAAIAPCLAEGIERPLGLTEDEVESVEAIVVNPEFQRRAVYLLQGNALNRQTWEQIDVEARACGISIRTKQKLLREPAARIFKGILETVFVQRHFTLEDAHSIVDFSQRYDVSVDTQNARKLRRCLQLTLLEQDTLVTEPSYVKFNNGEPCYFQSIAQIIQSPGFTPAYDHGFFGIWKTRIVFSGDSCDKCFLFATLYDVSDDPGYLVVQNIPGIWAKFQFEDEFDLEVAIRTIELLRSGRNITVAT